MESPITKTLGLLTTASGLFGGGGAEDPLECAEGVLVEAVPDG